MAYGKEAETLKDEWRLKEKTLAESIKDHIPEVEAETYDHFGQERIRYRLHGCLLTVFTREQSQGWSSFLPIGLAINVGYGHNTYEKDKIFPQKKDGSFSWDKIEADCLSRQERTKAKKEREAKQDDIYQTNKEAIKEILDSYRYFLTPSKTQLDRYEIKLTLTAKQLEAIIKILEE